MQVVYATSTAWVVNYQAAPTNSHQSASKQYFYLTTNQQPPPSEQSDYRLIIAEATNSKLAGEVSGELTRVGI